jgi:hypothetical protein
MKYIVAIYLILMLIVLPELNYIQATESASKTDGTDQEIRLEMARYGFNEDEVIFIEPTLIQKIKALYEIRG